MEMKNRQIIGYGLGSFGKDMALGVMGSYLLIFYTDVFGVSAAAVGMIMFLAKLWDAVNDPMMGTLVDRSKVTKWGKYRPYILFTAIPLALSTVLCFCSPNLSPAGKIVYVAITYTISGMIFTAYDVPLWSMVPTLTSDFNTRNKLIASARTFTTIAMLIASAAALPAIQALGGGDSVEQLKSGYPKFMLIIGIVSVIFAIITFVSTKEVNVIPEPEKKENIFREFTSVMNKQLVFVLLAMVFTAMAMIFPGISGTFYMIYYIGRADMIPVYMMVSMGVGMIASIGAPLIMKKIQAKKLAIGAFAVQAAVGFIVFLVGRGSLGILFVLFALVGLGTGTLMVTITSMLTDTADYMARKSGKRSDGVVFSMNSFAIKVGQAVASVAVSTILTVTGYAANAAQSEAALMGILSTRSIVPAVVSLIGIVFVACWNIPGEK